MTGCSNAQNPLPSSFVGDVAHSLRSPVCSQSRGHRRSWQQPAGRKFTTSSTVKRREYVKRSGKSRFNQYPGNPQKHGYIVHPTEDIITGVGMEEEDSAAGVLTSTAIQDLNGQEISVGNSSKAEESLPVTAVPPVRGKMGKRSIIRRSGFKPDAKILARNRHPRWKRPEKRAKGTLKYVRPQQILMEPLGDAVPVQPPVEDNVELLEKPGLPMKISLGGWQSVNSASSAANFVSSSETVDSNADWAPFIGEANTRFGSQGRALGVASRDHTSSASTSSNSNRRYGWTTYGRPVFIPTDRKMKHSRGLDLPADPEIWHGLSKERKQKIASIARKICGKRLDGHERKVSLVASADETLDESSDDSLEDTLDDTIDDDGFGGPASKFSAGTIFSEREKDAVIQLLQEIRPMQDTHTTHWNSQVLDEEGQQDYEDEVSTDDEDEALGVASLLMLLNKVSRLEGPRAAFIILELMQDAGGLGFPCTDIQVFQELLNSCDMCADADTALEIVDIMEMEGISLDIDCFNNAMGACAKGSRVEDVQRLFQRIVPLGLEPNTITYNKLLICAEKYNDWQSSMDIFWAMKSQGVDRSAYTYRSIIGTLTAANEDNLALQCLEWMSEDGVAPNDLIFDALIRHFLGKHKDVATGRKLVTSASAFGVTFGVATLRKFVTWGSNRRNMDSVHMVEVLQCMRDTGTMMTGKNGRLEMLRERELVALFRIYCSLLRNIQDNDPAQWESAVKIYKWMKEDNLNPGVSVVQRIMKLCWTAGEYESCVSLYQEVKAKEHHRHMGITMHASCSLAMLGKWDEVEKILQGLSECDVTTASGIYIGLINIAGNQGRIDKGMWVFDEACFNLGRNRAVYNSILRCCAKVPEIALKFFQEMKHFGIAGNRSTYGVIIGATAKEGMIDEMKSIWKIMLSEGIIPDIGLYHSMLAGFSSLGLLEDALELYEQIKNTAVAEGTSFLQLTLALQKSYHLDGSNKATELLEWMEGTKKDPASITKQVAEELRSSDEKWGEVVQLYEEHKTIKLQLREYTFQLLFRSCCREGGLERALELKNDMDAAGISWNLTLTTSILLCCTYNGDVDKGFEIIEEVKKQGVVPDIVSYSILIDCCSHEKVEMGWKRALDIFVDMQKNGIPPNTIVYNALLKVCIAKGKTEGTLDMLEHMKRHSECAPDSSTYSMLLRNLALEKKWEQAAAMYLESRQRGVWSTVGYGRKAHMVDLHLMSRGVAEVVIRTWLHHLRKEAMTGRFVSQPILKIVTGWGRNSETTGETKLKPVVEGLFLGGLGLALPENQLRVPHNNPGVYHIDKEVFYTWLMSEELDLGIDKYADLEVVSMSLTLEAD